MSERMGLYNKYPTEDIDGNFFLLKPDKDIHAIRAIQAYAESCREDSPELAIDLLIWAGSALEALKDSGGG